MARCVWRGLIGCELLLSTAVVVALAPTSWALALLAALATPVVAQLSLIATSILLGRARTARHERTRSFGPVLRALASELVWFSVAIVVLAFEALGCPPDLPAPPAGSPRPVLLVHGLACNRGIWRALFKRLHAAGFAPIRALDLQPVFADLDAHAARLARELVELHRECGGRPPVLVTHSMGGLVVRAALRSVDARIVGQLITIGAPHHGSALAIGLRSLEQLCPGSSWLATLNAGQEARPPVPVTSLYSLEDNLVAPPRSAVLAGARVEELRGLGHFGLLGARRSLDRVMAALTPRPCP